MDYRAKIFYNKKNKQAMITLSKRKLEILKHKKATFLKIREDDLEFKDDK